MTQSTFAGDLKSLPVSDRLKLIEDLWDSLDAEASEALPLPDWHREEIDNRLDAIESGASVGVPWSEVRQRTLGKS